MRFGEAEEKIFSWHQSSLFTAIQRSFILGRHRDGRSETAARRPGMAGGDGSQANSVLRTIGGSSMARRTSGPWFHEFRIGYVVFLEISWSPIVAEKMASGLLAYTGDGERSRKRMQPRRTHCTDTGSLKGSPHRDAWVTANHFGHDAKNG
jgi:hypothetical protein